MQAPRVLLLQLRRRGHALPVHHLRHRSPRQRARLHSRLQGRRYESDRIVTGNATYRGVMILALDPESDFQHFVDSGSGFWSSKKRNRTTY